MKLLIVLLPALLAFNAAPPAWAGALDAAGAIKLSVSAPDNAPAKPALQPAPDAPAAADTVSSMPLFKALLEGTEPDNDFDEQQVMDELVRVRAITPMQEFALRYVFSHSREKDCVDSTAVAMAILRNPRIADNQCLFIITTATKVEVSSFDYEGVLLALSSHGPIKEEIFSQLRDIMNSESRGIADSNRFLELLKS
ncbi:MAG TPA: hypothetical protein PLL10_07860 [Elusimicrobiales bacterium]|nr:hypothetical protein [Elusimicrobiales bacterium]